MQDFLILLLLGSGLDLFEFLFILFVLRCGVLRDFGNDVPQEENRHRIKKSKKDLAYRFIQSVVKAH